MAGLASASDTAEPAGDLVFLILHALRSRGGSDAADALEREAHHLGLLPRRTDPVAPRLPDGSLPTVVQSYSEAVATHPHIQHSHLLNLLQELMRLDAARRGPGAGVGSLLGAGYASLLPAAQTAAQLPPWTRWTQRDTSIARIQLLRETGATQTPGPARANSAACANPARGIPPALLCGALRRHRILRGHKAPVYCAITDLEGTRIITGSDDALVKLWCAHSGMLLHTCRGHEHEINFLAVSSTNSLLASASIDTTIRTWRLSDGTPVAVLMGHTQPVMELSFCPGGAAHAPNLLLSCSADGTVRLWDATRDSIPALCLDAGAPAQPDVIIVDDSSDGGDADHGGPSTQPPLSQRQASAPPQPQPAAAGSASKALFGSFSPDGTLAAASSLDFSIRLWRVNAHSCKAGGVPAASDVPLVTTLRGHRNDVQAVQFSPLSNVLATGSKDGTLRIWRPSAHQPPGPGSWTAVHTLMPPSPPPPPGSRARARLPPAVMTVRWAGDQAHVVLASLQDGSVCVWDVVTGHLHARLRRHVKEAGLLKELHVVEPHPVDARLVLTAGYDGRVCIWDMRRVCAQVPQQAKSPLLTGGEGAPGAGAGAVSAPMDPAELLEQERGIPAAEFDLQGSLPEDAMLLLDARWHLDGTGFVVSDASGAIHLFGTGSGKHLRGARSEQFFARDYEPLLRDQRGWVADAQTAQPPHVTRHSELLLAADEQPYADAYQTAFRNGTVLSSSAPLELLDDETLRNVRVDVAGELRRLRDRARGVLAPTHTPVVGGTRGGGTRAPRGQDGGPATGGGGGPGGRGGHRANGNVFYISDDPDSSSSSSSDEDDDFDGDLGAAGEDGSSDGATDEDGSEEDGSDGGGAGPSHGDALRRSSRRVRTRAAARTGADGSGDDEDGGRRRMRRRGRGAVDELEAAQPVYATRHASARLAAAVADASDDGAAEEGGSGSDGGEKRRARKRRRRDGSPHSDGGARRRDHSEDWDEYDSDESARARRRERDRRRRAAKAAAREAKRAAKRARRGGAPADDANGDGGAGGEGAGDEAARPRGHMPGASTFRADACFAWLQRTERTRGEYVPQLGDCVVYMAQGHCEYLDSCGDARASRPWTQITGFRAVEPCVVTGLEYHIMKDKGNATVARLTLTMADDALGQRGARFDVELPDMTQESSPDFIVDYSRYMTSCQQHLEPQSSRVMVWWPEAEDPAGGKWWMGTVWDVRPEDPAWPGSPWCRVHVVYDLGGEPEEHHSVWELFDPVPNTEPGALAAGQRWMPRPDSRIARLDDGLVAALLGVLDRLCNNTANAELLEAPPPETVVTQHLRSGGTFYYAARVALPIGLRTIQRRLQFGYYRQPDGVRHDAITLRSNALAVHGDEARISSAAITCCDKLLAELPEPSRPPVLTLPTRTLPPLVRVPRVVVTRGRSAAATAGPSTRAADVASPPRRSTTRAQAASQPPPPQDPGAGGRLSVRLRMTRQTTA